MVKKQTNQKIGDGKGQQMDVSGPLFDLVFINPPIGGIMRAYFIYI